jgi:hypothetical protein
VLDVFLVCDQQLFEVSLRGHIDERDEVWRLTEVLAMLPDPCTVVIDLSVVEGVSVGSANALTAVLKGERIGRRQVVVAAGYPAVKLTLLDAGVADVAVLVDTLSDARRTASSIFSGVM